MRLWTDEIESHRAEARSVLGLLREAPKPFQADPAGDLLEQAGSARELFSERISQAAAEPSESARDHVIEGPGGALRLRCVCSAATLRLCCGCSASALRPRYGCSAAALRMRCGSKGTLRITLR